ncbi:MAG: hypothetical protein GXP42_14565 [Chloroflexi bacterium]|nr:hypothetical protein [Chloroflexota bacterium]
MDYDIAIKEMLRLCSREILRRWLNIPVSESALIEDLPQETTSLRRSDFPLHVITEDGREMLVLIEIQTRWDPDLPPRMLEYRYRHKLRFGNRNAPIFSAAIVLTPSPGVTDYYQDEQVRFHYHLIPVYEMNAAEVVQDGITCMAPFVPVMRDGEKWFRQADELIEKSDLSNMTKADMYTAMGIISGLTSRRLLQQLLQRRHEIMIESAFFEVLREEIEKEVKEEAWQQGLQQGLRSGYLDAIALGLDLRFGAEGLKLLPEIEAIADVSTLRAIREALHSVESPEELRTIYQ